MPADSFLRLLQFSDGLFPAGGYAHSFGLETLVQSGGVQNANDVTSFLHAYLESSVAPTDAVAVLCVRKYVLAGDLDACVRLDQYLDALKSPAELRDASRQMGRQTLRVLNELAKIGDCHSGRAERTTEGRTPSDEESLFAASEGHGPQICHPARSRRPDQGRSPERAERAEGALFGAVEGSLFAASEGHGPLICHPERSRRPDQGRSPERAERAEGALFGEVEGSAFSFSRRAASNREEASSLLGGRTFSSDITTPSREGVSTPEACADVSGQSPSTSSSHSPLDTSHFCSRFAAAVESGATPCHHPTVFGIAAAANNWEPRETASAFLYSTSAVIVGASLRLLPLGQLAGQRILAEAGSLIAALSETIADKSVDDMWSFTPELEIAAMQHESLDGRLFRS